MIKKSPSGMKQHRRGDFTYYIKLINCFPDEVYEP